MLRLQTIFNRAVNKVLEQGKQSTDASSGDCAYRGANGARCPVGWCITNKNYSPNMEGKVLHPTGSVRSAVHMSIGDLPDRGYPLLRMLQSRHDSLEALPFSREFYKNAEEIALKFDLSMKGIKYRLCGRGVTRV